MSLGEFLSFLCYEIARRAIVSVLQKSDKMQQLINTVMSFSPIGDILITTSISVAIVDLFMGLCLLF